MSTRSKKRRTHRVEENDAHPQHAVRRVDPAQVHRLALAARRAPDPDLIQPLRPVPQALHARPRNLVKRAPFQRVEAERAALGPDRLGRAPRRGQQAVVQLQGLRASAGRNDVEAALGARWPGPAAPRGRPGGRACRGSFGVEANSGFHKEGAAEAVAIARVVGAPISGESGGAEGRESGVPFPFPCSPPTATASCPWALDGASRPGLVVHGRRHHRPSAA